MYKIVNKVHRICIENWVDKSYYYNNTRYYSTKKVLEKHIPKDKFHEWKEIKWSYTYWNDWKKYSIETTTKYNVERFVYKRSDDEVNWINITNNYF